MIHQCDTTQIAEAVLAIAWIRRITNDGCWSGPSHLQGANNRTLCGIPYALHWGFELVEGVVEKWIGCGRCQRMIAHQANLESKEPKK